MSVFTYDVAKTISMLEEEQKKLERELAGRDEKRKNARIEWRKALVKFARRLLDPRTGALTDDRRFQSKVFRDSGSGKDDYPCLERLGPPKFGRPDFRKLDGNLSRIRSRIQALRALRDGKKLRMHVDRFEKYVRGESV